MRDFEAYVLSHDSEVDDVFQSRIAEIDGHLRARFGMQADQTALGVLDLRNLRLALLNPDRMEYAASIPKLSILLAYFQVHFHVASGLDSTTRRELGLMIKASDNEMATRFSRELGLSQIQQVLDSYGFYDRDHGGGIWMGKHYGDDSERIRDPIGDNSHAATVRQLLRFYLLLEQGRLVSREASARMREIFASPEIPHDAIKFVKGLDGRGLEVLRKWGSWEDWLHDSAIIIGPGRHYILAALTHHPKGDEYLTELARAVDTCLELEQRTR